MPELGEIRRGIAIGHVDNHEYVWTTCAECGKERWVILVKGKPKYSKCLCVTRGEKSPKWRGGRKRGSRGYIMVKLSPNDFFYPMAQSRGYVMEHRLMVAKGLGRCLQPWEIVHHKDGIRNHNTDNNLQLVSDIGHKQISIMERKINQLLEQNQELKQGQEDLRKQIRLLQWQINERSIICHSNKI